VLFAQPPLDAVLAICSQIRFAAFGLEANQWQ
jgi:hypothetical protein